MFTTHDSNTATCCGELDGADDGCHRGRSASAAAGGGVCCVHTGTTRSLAAFSTRVAAVTRLCPTAPARDCDAARASFPAVMNVFMLRAAHLATRDMGACASAYSN
jgi:hypothetical protein